MASIWQPFYDTRRLLSEDEAAAAPYEGNPYFSLVVFFICMRDAIEAGVIIAIMLQAMGRIMPPLRKHVWIGAISGLTVSLILGAGIIAGFYAAKNYLFQGESKEIFEATIAWVAAILIGVLGFAMLRFTTLEPRLKRKLTKVAEQAALQAQGNSADVSAKVDAEAAVVKAAPGDMAAPPSVPTPLRKHIAPVIVVTFLIVFREGLEAILFIFGIGSNTPASAIPLAAITGLAVGAIVGLVVYWTGSSLRQLKVFFICIAVVLIFVGAGQISYGVQEFTESGAFGVTHDAVEEAEDEGEEPPALPWWNTVVYDISGCCNAEKGKSNNAFFQLMGAIFGWNAEPTALWWILWGGYLVVCAVLAVVMYFRGTLFDSDGALRRKLAKQGVDPGSEQMEEMIDEIKAAKKERKRAMVRSLTCGACGGRPTPVAAQPITGVVGAKSVEPLV